MPSFFGISLSSRRTFTSRPRRLNSARSSVVSPSRSPASISAWRTQFLSDSGATPRSQAILGTGRCASEDQTNRTASSLNSAG
jgi:hypothetical protein